MAEWKTAGKVRMTPKGVHDSTIAYNILDLVSNEDHTMYYIAKQDVPANTLITNTDYWDVMMDVTEIPDQIEELANDITDLETYVREMSPLMTSGPSPVVSVVDAAPLSAEDVLIAVEPVQDLHGQNAPYPAGGGVAMAQFCGDDYSKTQNDITFTFTKASEAFSITGTNGKTDENWILFNNQDSFVCQQLTVGESYVFSHNMPSGTYAQITYYNTSSGTSGLVYLRGTGEFNSQSFTVPDNFSSLRAFQIGIEASTGTLSATGIHFEISKSTPTAWSPYSNICPISGWTGVNVWRTRKNIFPGPSVLPTNPNISIVQNDDGSYKFTATSTITAGSIYFFGEPNTANYKIPLVAGKTYLISGMNVQINGVTRGTQTTPYLLTAQKGDYINAVWAYFNSTMLPTGNSETLYPLILLDATSTSDPYTSWLGNDTYTVDWTDEAGTVYGGTLDLTAGTLTVDRAIYTITGNESWEQWGLGYFSSTLTTYARNDAQTVNGAAEAALFVKTGDIYSDVYPMICTMGARNASLYINQAAKDNINAYTGTKVCYILATPVTYTLDPVTLTLLRGANTVWADTGDTTLAYRADLPTYIDERTRETRSMIAGIETGMTATRAYSAGDLLIVGDTLYKATTAIANGAAFTPGTNVTATTVAEQLILLANA